MGQLVLLVVAAAWAAVLVPPLLRSRIENRPNSSVTDFANQLSSLQRAMPTRGVAMRSMARPLAPSPLSRPAAPGRPPLRSGVRTHVGPWPTPVRRTPAARPRHTDRTRVYDATPRPRSHAGRQAATAVRDRNALKRRRANVLFVLAMVAGCSLFLAATTKAQALLWFSCAAFAALCVYVYVLGQMRRQEESAQRGPAASAPGPGRPPALGGPPPHAAGTGASPRSPAPRTTRSPGRLVRRVARVDRGPARARPDDRRLRGSSVEPAETDAAQSVAGRYTRGPRGCSSVGRAQQSHC